MANRGIVVVMNRNSPERPPILPIAQLAAQLQGEGARDVSLRTLRRWADTGRITKYVDSSGFVYLDPVEVRAELHIAPASEALS